MKLSIITVNLNNLAGLKKTMRSVFEQTFTDYEYIIIDGGSTDGSKEYIEQHADRLSYWVSEKDGGVYEAMNKGIRVTKGKYLNFLNSGDYYCNPFVLKNVFKFIEINGADIYYGNMQMEVEGKIKTKIYPEKLDLEYLSFHPLNHQSIFYKRGVFDSVGFYNLDYSFASDHLLNVEAFLSDEAFLHLKQIIVNYNLDGISQNNWQKYRSELIEIEQNRIPRFAKALLLENRRYKLLLNSRTVRLAVGFRNLVVKFKKSIKGK